VKKIALIRWFRDVPIATKLYFTVGIMATLIALELGALMFSINTLSSVRAYVGGEGLWSKAQKDAMYQLLKYGRSHDEADYVRFSEFMRVPLGDHDALVELNKPIPDMEAAKRGFIAGRNHPEDVDGMITLFTRFNRNEYINRAIHIWIDADKAVTEFIPIAEELHSEINTPIPSQQHINFVLLKLDPVNRRITVLEDDFSYTLGEGSRWLESLILKLLFAIALTVELTGLLIAILISRNIQKGLNEILQSAKAVAKGDFSRKAKAFSKDEIGVLAENFNAMSTGLEQSIRKIEHAQKKFRDLLESAPDAILIVGRGDIIQLVNKQCELIFGYTREELVGHRINLLISSQPDDNASSDSKNLFFSSPYMGQTGSGIELTCMRKNGQEFPAELSVSPLVTEDGIIVSVALRDISERKYIKELERKNKELEQFTYISSHDLQEPINTIMGLSILLEENHRHGLDEEGLSYVRYIHESSLRMTTLISGLLAYSRLGHARKIEIINCNELVGQVLADIKAKIDKNKAIIHIDKLPVINGSNLELRLLFQNLLSNAIKFSKKDIPPIIKINAKLVNRHYHFTIEDNGIGMEQKHLEKIFFIFQRLNSLQEYEGSGIGLAHCKKIVVLHGGEIWVESEAGKGSTFHFTFPQLEPNQKQHELHLTG
jgi:PAS domain S-box-containing protein